MPFFFNQWSFLYLYFTQCCYCTPKCTLTKVSQSLSLALVEIVPGCVRFISQNDCCNRKKNVLCSSQDSHLQSAHTKHPVNMYTITVYNSTLMCGLGEDGFSSSPCRFFSQVLSGIFFLLPLSLCENSICCWRSKYTFRFLQTCFVPMSIGKIVERNKKGIKKKNLTIVNKKCFLHKTYQTTC